MQYTLDDDDDDDSQDNAPKRLRSRIIIHVYESSL